jgi:3-isopropylmalate/(R)-2-methylmalate dehydratase small subunit
MGSSREQAPLVIREAGVNAVIAKSFARIFYRNAFNIGLCLIETDTDKIYDKDFLEIDLDSGAIVNKTRDDTFKIKPLPLFMQELLKAGGIVNYFKKHGELKI